MKDAPRTAVPVSSTYPTVEMIDNWFQYHAPTPEQVVQYQGLREAGKVLALAIWNTCPPGADRTTAIRMVREAVMTANASIACGGK